MATFVTKGILQSGVQLTLNASDHIWVSGATFGSNIIVGSYQDSTHISDTNDVLRDTTASVNNMKFLTSTTASVNSAASVSLSTVTSGSAPFMFVFSHGSSVATSAATFYAWDGTTSTSPLSGISFQAAEIGNSTWTAANGSGAALTLANQSASTSHTFYIALSASPTNTGAKVGSLTLQLSFS